MRGAERPQRRRVREGDGPPLFVGGSCREGEERSEQVLCHLRGCDILVAERNVFPGPIMKWIDRGLPPTVFLDTYSFEKRYSAYDAV